MSAAFAARMAWRESRAALGRLALFALSIACGVAALVATESVSTNLQRRVREEARTLLAADVEIRCRKPLTDELKARVAALAPRGVRAVATVETMSMVSSPDTTATRLAEVKAVGEGYPFYGALKAEPASALDAFRRGDGILVSPALLVQMGLAVGAKLDVGELTLPVAGVLTGEPDRFGDSFRIGPRVLVRAAELERARLIRKGSRATWRLLLATGEAPAARIAKELEDAADGKDVELRTADEGQPAVERFLSRVTIFLNLVGLAVLLLAGIGIGVAIHTFMSQRLDTLAILKCLGATEGTVLSAYLMQALVLALAGSAVGAGAGTLLPLALPRLLAGVLPFPVEIVPVPQAMARGLAIGVALSLAFALPPLLSVRRVRPLAIFARAVSSARPDPAAVAAVVVLAGACALLAAWRAGGRDLAAGFLGGFAVAVLAVWLGAQVLLVVARRLARFGSFPVRYAIAGLRRPGNQTASVTVALGLGVFLVATVFRIDSVLRRDFADGVSESAPNLFVVDLQDDQLAGMREALAQHGVEPQEVAALVRSARLTAIGDRKVEELYPDMDRAPWWINREYTLTFRDAPGDAERVEAGRFWQPGSPAPEVSLEQRTAERLGAGLGSWITLDILGAQRRVQVTSIRSVRWTSMRPNFFMLLPPAQLAGVPRTWFAVTRIPAAATRAAVQRELVRRFPNLMVLDVTLGLELVRGFVSRLAWVIGLAALLCVAGGILVMAASVVMTRHHRMREAAILKAQGVTGRQLVGMLALEYGILGAVAGAVGALAAGLVASELAQRLFDAQLAWQLAPVPVAGAATALLTALTGAAASRGMLARPALEILREDA